MAAGFSAVACLEEMESTFEANHFFANTSVLSLVCERTATPKNLLLQNGLLAWVVEGLTLKALQENDGRNVSLPASSVRVTQLRFRKIIICLTTLRAWQENKVPLFSLHVRMLLPNS